MTDRPYVGPTFHEKKAAHIAERLLRAREDLRRVTFHAEYLEAELTCSHDALQASRQAVARAVIRADRLETELATVLNSTSWRLTKPARVIVRCLLTRGRLRSIRDYLRKVVGTT